MVTDKKKVAVGKFVEWLYRKGFCISHIETKTPLYQEECIEEAIPKFFNEMGDTL